MSDPSFILKKKKHTDQRTKDHWTNWRKSRSSLQEVRIEALFSSSFVQVFMQKFGSSQIILGHHKKYSLSGKISLLLKLSKGCVLETTRWKQCDSWRNEWEFLFFPRHCAKTIQQLHKTTLCIACNVECTGVKDTHFYATIKQRYSTKSAEEFLDSQCCRTEASSQWEFCSRQCRSLWAVF